jgi:hypothetical protein
MAAKLKIEKRGNEIKKEISEKKIFMGISHRVLC